MQITTPCGHEVDLPDKFLGLRFTADCPTCDSLLMIQTVEGKFTAKHFHEYMHKQNPSWPKDGSNTGYIEI